MVCLNNNNMIFSGLGWTAEHAETSMVEHLNRSVSEYRDKQRIEEPCYNPDLRDKLKEEQKQSLRYFLFLCFIFSFDEILFVTLNFTCRASKSLHRPLLLVSTPICASGKS